MNTLSSNRRIQARQPQHNRARLRLAVIVPGVLVVLMIIALTPWGIGSLHSRPQPAATYAEALQRIDALQGQATAAMTPGCQLQLLSHGQRVEHAIVLVHGYTSCPQQFHDLGQQFYTLGYNVLIAPLPHHGLADRLTDTQALLRAEELATYADQVMDIAGGLGAHITMGGISGGGVVTAWTAQYRSDLDLAVLISPAFGFLEIATPLTAPLTNYYRVKPNTFVWWDEALQAGYGIPFQYPRYSTRALAEILRLGFAVQAAARTAPPAARAILVISNPNDDSVNPVLIRNVVEDWHAHQAQITTYEFDAALRLPHDLIDKVDQQTKNELVYPRLIELITQAGK